MIRHLAIIMDGNRRWAASQGLKSADGHRAGAEALIRIVRYASKLNIKYLTVYALSTENIVNRDKGEVASIFKILQEKIFEHLAELKKEGIRIEILGETSSLPKLVQKAIAKAYQTLSSNNQYQLNIALNYGGRAEIIQALRKIGKEKIDLKTIKEDDFNDFLYTKNIPDPDLLIRTGGQKRISNFLLWQSAYSEFYFTDTLWPDFSERDLDAAIEEFQTRTRNFGK